MTPFNHGTKTRIVGPKYTFQGLLKQLCAIVELKLIEEGGYEIRAEILTEDATKDGYPIKIESVGYQVRENASQQEIDNKVIECLADLFYHEIEEGLFRDGRHVRPPHASTVAYYVPIYTNADPVFITGPIATND